MSYAAIYIQVSSCKRRCATLKGVGVALSGFHESFGCVNTCHKRKDSDIIAVSPFSACLSGSEVVLQAMFSIPFSSPPHLERSYVSSCTS